MLVSQIFEVYMAVKTNNIYGRITISDNTIERFVSHVSKDCYGIVSFVPLDFVDRVLNFVRLRTDTCGIKVRTQGDRIFIDVGVCVKYGVSIKAVVEALKESVQYKVERFTGMIVDTINVNVKSIQR